MTPTGLSAKDALDAQLVGGNQDISIAMGFALYSDLGAAGHIKIEQCRAVGFAHLIDWPMYGQGRFVHVDWNLDPYGFLVGQAGI